MHTVNCIKGAAHPACARKFNLYQPSHIHSSPSGAGHQNSFAFLPRSGIMKVPLWLLLCFPVPSLSVKHYYQETMRGPRDLRKPKHPVGKELLDKRKTQIGKRSDVIFEVESCNQFSRALLKTPITSTSPDGTYAGEQELTSGYSVVRWDLYFLQQKLIRGHS